MQRWYENRQKVESSAVAGKESPAVADNGRTPGLQISGCMFLMEVREREAEEWVRGSCCMVPMESRQKEDEEVSSQATTLQFGSPGKSRGEEYVCPGHPHCEKGKGKDEVKRETVEERKARMEELREQWLRNEIRDVAEFARRAYGAPEGTKVNVMARGRGKGRSGGRDAPKKGKGKGTSKGKSTEAHELKSCDTGTLRYRADVPLNARRGALVDRSPQGLQDTISWAHTTPQRRCQEPGGRSGTGTDTDLSDFSTDSD